MSDSTTELGLRLRQLRESFDSSFSRPVDLFTAASSDMALCCRVGNQLCALPVTDVSGIFKIQNLFAVPARARGFLGIGIFRSAMVPVYDLGTFMGAEASARDGWSILLGRSDIVGAKVDAIDGYASFDPAMLSFHNEESMRYLRGVVHYKANSYGLIDAKSLHHDLIRRER